MQSESIVSDFYRANVAREWRRLVKSPFNRLEYETTFYYLKKHLPPSGLVIDAGGGPGRYTIALAELGYDVILYDLTPDNLTFARRRIARARVKGRIQDIADGSIVDLSRYPSGHFDAVLCLGGPLSHVDGSDERLRAMRELRRIAKPGAPVFISVMGLLAVLSETPRYWPQWIGVDDKFRKAWQTGDDRAWCKTSFAHFFLPEEFRDLVEAGGLEIVECVGLEGLGSHSIQEINRLARNDPDAWKNWLEAHAALRTHP
ncbi:MAG TPA: class I SAM-dependent methyltransferase, partial [Chloroflexota bacterium]|nr:class I SAM-dependent methyltransferase [Chloroflexota bacterium]